VTQFDDRSDDIGPLLDALANYRRRLVIRILDADTSHQVRTVADIIAGIETDDTEPTSRHRQTVYVSLYQTHLPVLDDTQIVSYDDQAKRVSHGALFAPAAEILRCVDDVI